MKQKNIKGKCHICGEYKELTFEHIPPHKAFNFSPAKVIQGDEAIKLVTESGRLPWDTTNLKYKNQQRGMGDYTLCQQCNNLTGTLYGETYIFTAYSMFKLMNDNKLEINTPYIIHVNNIKLSRFSRQVLSMFCSTCPSITERYPIVKDIIINKKSASNLPFKIKAYLLKNTKISYTGIMAMFIKDIGIKTVAQIDAFPFLFILELENQTDKNGWDLTKYLSLDIDKEVEEDIEISLVEHNSMFPSDFRTKKQFNRKK